jgi:hypothetical protein
MRFKSTLILLVLPLAICLPLFSQNAANDSDQIQTALKFFGHPVYYNFPPQDVVWLKSQGWPDGQIKNAVFVPYLNESPYDWKQLTNFYHTAHFNIYQICSSNIVVPTTPENQFSMIGLTSSVPQMASTEPSTNQQQTVSGSTPFGQNAAIIFLGYFFGITNAAVSGDVISVAPGALKFRCYGQEYNYSGNYTVIFNTPRAHKNPYFGFGSPETANILILEDVGGNVFPFQYATIWDKSANYVDAVANGKEWIYSGTYTIQNQ